MTSCTATLDVVFAAGGRGTLSCSLEAGEAHAGLNHHDSEHDIWWRRGERDDPATPEK